MKRREYVEVDIDLDDFSDDQILEEAQSRGLGIKEADVVNELAFAIERGDKPDAHVLLERMLQGSAVLVEAARTGRRRQR